MVVKPTKEGVIGRGGVKRSWAFYEINVKKEKGGPLKKARSPGLVVWPPGGRRIGITGGVNVFTLTLVLLAF